MSDGVASVKHKRRSSILGMSFSSSSNSLAHEASQPGLATASFYATKKAKKPFLTLTDVHYVAASYPENEKMIKQSSIFKVDGRATWDVSGSADRPKDMSSTAIKPETHAASFMLMPDDQHVARQEGMLSWILAFCDAFKVRLCFVGSYNYTKS